MRWILVTLVCLNLVYGVGQQLGWWRPSGNALGAAGDGAAPGEAAAASELVRLEELSAAQRSALQARPVPERVPAVDEASTPSEDAGASASPPPARANLAQEPTQGIAGLCAVLGPFDSRRAALDFRAQHLDAPAEPISIKVNRQPMHWVMLAPLESRQKAMKRLRALHERGIDSYVITRGEFENAISLGVFENEASARGILDNYRRAGLDPKVERVVWPEREHWLQVAPEHAQRVPMPEMLGGEGVPAELERKRAQCKAIAEG